MPSMTLENQIVDVLKVMPNLTTPEIITLIPDRRSESVVSQISLASRGGRLLREPIPRKPGQRGGTQYRYSVNPNFVTSSHKPVQRKPKLTDNGMAARLDIANKLVSELQAWKVDAIARYPDLAVDPTVIEARKILARVLRDIGDKHGSDEVMCGRRDTTVAMLATVEAVSRSI